MKITRKGRGFTLIELLVVIGIIVLLAALVLGSGNPASSKRQVTQGTMETVAAALESYYARFGEYPEPVNADETAEIMPGKVYRIGAARCLYQALRGDGYDAIKVAARGEKGEAQSDGKVSADEIKNVIMADMPEVCGARWAAVTSSSIPLGVLFNTSKPTAQRKTPLTPPMTFGHILKMTKTSWPNPKTPRPMRASMPSG